MELTKTPFNPSSNSITIKRTIKKVYSADNILEAAANKGRIKLPKVKDLTISELGYLFMYFKEIEKITNGND